MNHLRRIVCAGTLMTAIGTAAAGPSSLEGRCRAAEGRVVAIPIVAVRPLRNAEVEVTLASGDDRPAVTVPLGSLTAVASRYGELRVGRAIRVHCSEPTIEFRD